MARPVGVRMAGVVVVTVVVTIVRVVRVLGG
jgi:hypothetical protein